MLPALREELITKLIEDVVESAFQDAAYAAEFIDNAMRDGYKPMSEKTDEQLLQWHIDAFDEEFIKEEPS